MGPATSRTHQQDLSILPKNLLVQLAFPQIGEKFQKAEFFYKTKEMKIHIPVDNETIINHWNQNVHLLHEDQMKKYILLPKSYSFEKQAFCGSAGIAKIIYDYFPFTLEGQVLNRKKSIDNQQFSQAQLWKILYTLLKASQLMHKNWKKVGDIRPKNLFYNQQKQLRVSSQYSYPRQLTNYQKFVFQKEPAYIAPQQMQDIKMGRIDPDQSRNAKQYIIQAESWSIGLTLLHVSLLFNFQIIYDPLKCEINFQLLKEKILDLENKKSLSLALKNIIKSLIQEIPQRRLLASQLLLNYMQPYIQKIQKLEPFDTARLNLQVKQAMQKRSLSSLIGTVWKACNTGLIQSLVINNLNTQRNTADNQTKQALLLQQLQKYSQIPPKNSQVSMRESIRLGRSRKKMTQSNVNVKQSERSNQSFHTVNSLRLSKKQPNLPYSSKISSYGIENRFGLHRMPTSGENISPLKTQTFDNISQKFMTPLEQSSYYHTIHGNERSFDFNSIGLFNSTFMNSQTIEDPNFLQKMKGETRDSESKFLFEGNFKKQKSKSKQKS